MGRYQLTHLHFALGSRNYSTGGCAVSGVGRRRILVKIAKGINHEKRIGLQYAMKPPVTDETKRKRSESMKAFSGKTGKVTTLANTQVRSKKPSA